MKRIALVLVVLAYVAAPAIADMTVFLSGDSNIANPLTGVSTPIEPGNQQFFDNVLGAGTNVAVLRATYYAHAEIHKYYDGLAGVTSTIFSGPVTDLSGVDLLVVATPDNAFTAAEIAVMRDFLSGGGDIFFLGDNLNFVARNANINNALIGLGSSLSIVDATVGFNWPVATGGQIAVDPYTAGVDRFKYAATSLVNGGTTLFYTGDQDPFVTYEAIPTPGAALLAFLGLTFAGERLRRRRA